VTWVRARRGRARVTRIPDCETDAMLTALLRNREGHSREACDRLRRRADPLRRTGRPRPAQRRRPTSGERRGRLLGCTIERGYRSHIRQILESHLKFVIVTLAWVCLRRLRISVLSLPEQYQGLFAPITEATTHTVARSNSGPRKRFISSCPASTIANPSPCRDIRPHERCRLRRRRERARTARPGAIGRGPGLTSGTGRRRPTSKAVE
jgi:hypothetical protein